MVSLPRRLGVGRTRVRGEKSRDVSQAGLWALAFWGATCTLGALLEEELAVGGELAGEDERVACWR